MMKMLTACTSKIYDPDLAAEEILTQLGIPGSLLRNSVGIIACYYEFVDFEGVKAISDALPFDVIGCTAMGSAVSAASALDQLSITVLTGDDLEFSVALSEAIIDGGEEEPIRGVYTEALGKLSGAPSLIFALAPILTDVSGDFMLRLLDYFSGGEIPIFGTLSNDTALTYENAKVFAGGEIHARKMALLLIRGNIQPAFFVMAISESHIQQQSAIVTSAEGYRLKEVNNMPLIGYLESIGIDTYGLSAATTLPLLVDFMDGGGSIACSMYAITEEGALTGFEIPSGALLTFAEVDYGSVMDTAEAAVTAAKDYAAQNGGSGIITVSCLSRCLVLAPDQTAEMERSRAITGGQLPFFLMYSGGEICPVNTLDGKMINRFHNLTYTLMVI
ncbi:MAG: FIST C-terminal domain-containing protein [Clostridiales Family XIII bacterium]|jgi:hypothetical protein|nr:FIST C-terminal domain-containing protein [Clostridiales Family XIII bacterium]